MTTEDGWGVNVYGKHDEQCLKDHNGRLWIDGATYFDVFNGGDPLGKLSKMSGITVIGFAITRARAIRHSVEAPE